jgi:hypothetical protein
MQQLMGIPRNTRCMYKALAISQASADRDADAESPSLEWKEPHDFTAVREHGNACGWAKLPDSDGELRAQERIRQVPRFTLHHVPCSNFIWAKISGMYHRDLHLVLPNSPDDGAAVSTPRQQLGLELL